MAVDHAKILKFLDGYRQILRTEDNQYKFYLAICQVQLGNYAEGQHLFDESCKGMLKTRLWVATSQPNWLVDICLLAGRADLYPKVLRELETYKTDSRGDSLVALYAYALIELLMHFETDITNRIQGLLKKPKVKDTFAIGQTLQAILDEDQIALDSALANLLKAHEGMARYGNLRETAEGLLCMPAMSLAYVALKCKLKVRMENKYLSIGYRQHLLKHERE